MTASRNIRAAEASAALEQLGVKQELKRNFSMTSMLGLAFAILNTWTALAASITLALPSGGPSAVIWGLLGPMRMFSPGQIYSGLFIFFGVGAVTPVVFYFAARHWPRSPVKYLMAPLIFGGSGAIPPASPLNYLS